MTAPLLLDFYCGEGGVGMGYHRAGFEVVGVDDQPMPRYPFPFILGDAIDILTRMLQGKKCQASDGCWYGIDDFNAIHASPPCQDFIPTIPEKHGTAHFLPDTRELFLKTSKPWVIENIPGAPMRADYRLCGCMFRLPRLRRQRLFETSWNGFSLMPPCQHDEHPISVVGHGIPSGHYYRDKLNYRQYIKLAKDAMGIDWMSRDGLSQAIPPAYTEYIGRQLLAMAARP